MKRAALLVMIILVATLVSAAVFSPNRNIEMHGVFGMRNATTVNSTLFCDNVGNCANITTLNASGSAIGGSDGGINATGTAYGVAFYDGTALRLGSAINITWDNTTMTLNISNLRVRGLQSCDTINTTSDGTLVCGNDADTGGGAIDTNVLDIVNQSMLDNGSIVRSGVNDTFISSFDSSSAKNCSSIGNGTLIGNSSCFQLKSRKWIDSGEIIDIDKEVIEGDMNTFVDIPGDNMTGNLQMGGNNITHIGVVNATNVTATSLSGILNWSFLQGYPSACSNSQTLTSLADVLVCSAISITESQISDLSHTVNIFTAVDQIYLSNSTGTISFNESKLNITVPTIKVNNATGADKASTLTGTITESQISDLSPHTNRSDDDIRSVTNGLVNSTTWSLNGTTAQHTDASMIQLNIQADVRLCFGNATKSCILYNSTLGGLVTGVPG
tara:strand:- start:1145 stop:2473 length:1329 start_codon:yes stop_codon:yes gene_type:complete